MRKSKATIQNFWELKPTRLEKWETISENKVVVLVPKFRNLLLKKWFLPRLSKSFVRVNLDEIGSTIWLHCDGATTVQTIAEELKKKFGDKIEPIEERLVKFFHQIERGDLISMKSVD
jgi:hypothetical protein